MADFCSIWNQLYRGADKSLARPASLYILFDGENISFDASLVIYIYSTNILPIMIINRIKVKVKAVGGSYSTAALRHIVLLPE